MSKPLHTVSTSPVSVLVPSESVQLAKELAQQHPHSELIEPTYRNLLSVLVVSNYLKMLDIPTDVSQCDCWNPLLRLTSNVADLELVGYGRFECCPVTPVESAKPSPTFTVPAEMQEERVGYIVVQIDGDVEEAAPTVHILGFSESLVGEQTGEDLPLSQLRSLFDLPDYLASIKHTCLSDWLQNWIEDRWQALDQLLEPQIYRTLQVQTRSSEIKLRQIQGKPLTFKAQAVDKDDQQVSDNEEVILIAEVTDTQDKRLDIELKICPTTEQAFLPPGLAMTIVDSLGDPVMQANARQENRMMELGFHAELGDRFQLLVTLEDETLVESFVV